MTMCLSVGESNPRLGPPLLLAKQEADQTYDTNCYNSRQLTDRARLMGTVVPAERPLPFVVFFSGSARHRCLLLLAKADHRQAPLSESTCPWGVVQNFAPWLGTGAGGFAQDMTELEIFG